MTGLKQDKLWKKIEMAGLKQDKHMINLFSVKAL